MRRFVVVLLTAEEAGTPLDTAAVMDNITGKRSRNYGVSDSLDLAEWLMDRENAYTLTEPNIRERISEL
jgi:hypothetical protein